jgi:hypothetical protein
MRTAATPHLQQGRPHRARDSSVSLSSRDLKIDRCYATRSGELRKIVGFDGSYVLFVVGHKGTFAVWDKRRWCSMLRPHFVEEITSEIGLPKSGLGKH